MRDLPRVGLGTAPLGGMFSPVGDDAAAKTIESAIDHGWTFVDTAPLYGHGLSEQRVGAALRAGGHDVVLSTKVGRLVHRVDRRAPEDLFLGAPPGAATFDLTAGGVRRSLEASLDRLGRDRVDVALVHDPEQHLEVAIGKAIPTLRSLQDDGVVAAVGVGTNEVETAVRFVRDAGVDVVLIAGRCSLLDRNAERDLLPLCAERGVAVVVGGVFNSGVLADPASGRYAYGDVPAGVRERVARMHRACASHDVPLAAAAIQHPRRHPGVTSIVVGCRSPQEVETNASLLEVVIPDDLWQQLDAIGREEP